jgi:hypothetical protein
MSHRHSKKRRIATALVVAVAVYWVAAYVVAPLVWEGYIAWRPSFDDDPRITKTSDGHPGDPLNVAIYSEEASLESAMKDAGWYPAAALGLRSDLRIADDTILSRPDDEAPVSNLYLYGRKEDLAFEMPVGDNPRQRHHVRFWKTTRTDAADRPLWIGSASYDERVGLSDTTGQMSMSSATTCLRTSKRRAASRKTRPSLAFTLSSKVATAAATVGVPTAASTSAQLNSMGE